MNGNQFFKAYESYCPKELSMKDDAVGLQVGTLDKEFKKILVTLDIREDTVAEAIENNVDCILAKHALIFRPVSTLVEEDTQQKLILDLIQAGISVYISHTNIDIVDGGINDYFCQLLDINDTEFLSQTSDNNGIGRIGNIEKQTLGEFIDKTKKAFDLDDIRLVSYEKDLNREISRVAICGGTGGSFFKDALDKKADLFITGDVYYHSAHDMISSGVIVLDPGHYIEKDFIPLVAGKLRQLTSGVEIIESKANTNPFITL
ncbi:Nif3-like dinuclear metal center hexameric protein [Floricoccus tropicus]|uniref:GTP cyclohydrolase 1 type 2 homolog n=1 Tax=Floricoccus tropicus TaxID=1859473 RepID=A0A1E8GSF5_9LACT|nr:Nif3-like dinuclear metal center hexameric protein [Floricoccus tropicus]OFI50533.1 Nif3-like dinuclear metal center hexameric protein [Floricoccus tropicus]